MARHTRPAATIAALGLVASLGIAAADGDCYVALENDPSTPEDDVEACEEQHWFHRGATHASNLGQLDPTGTHGVPTFDTIPPAGSVSEGNGGGYASYATLLVDGDDGVLDAPFNGTFTGVLDRMDIDIHFLAALYSGVDLPEVLDIEVTVDGGTVFTADAVEVLTVVEEASAAGSRRADIAITGLAERLASFAGFENGPETVHEIELRIGPGQFADNAYVLAFDTTEVPGGITFNKKEIDPGTLVLDAG